MRGPYNKDCSILVSIWGILLFKETAILLGYFDPEDNRKDDVDKSHAFVPCWLSSDMPPPPVGLGF